MKVCFTLYIDRLIVLNTSRSNRCITVRDDAIFSSRVSTHLLQIFIFSSAGGTWRLACICELLSLPPGLPPTDVNGRCRLLGIPRYSP
jgi:hypothetical protein